MKSIKKASTKTTGWIPSILAIVAVSSAWMYQIAIAIK